MKKTIALILTASALFIAGCCTTHQTTKWEYKVVHTIGGVNERAAKGWSVDKVTIKPDGSHEYLLKRQIQ
jgi:protein involved in sex pheromone biosynthesis